MADAVAAAGNPYRPFCSESCPAKISKSRTIFYYMEFIPNRRTALDRRIVCGIPPAVTAIFIRTGFNFLTFDQRPIVIAGEKTGVGGLNFGTGRRILQLFDDMASISRAKSDG